MDTKQPNDNNQQDGDQAMDQWFHNLGSTQSPPEPPVQRHTKKYVLLVLIGLFLITSAVFTMLLLSTREKDSVVSACFNEDNYKDLVSLVAAENTDETLASNLEQDKVFYTHNIYFNDQALSYNTGIANDPTAFMDNLGSYSQDASKEASFKISLSSNYLDTDTASLTDQRLQKIKSYLVGAGMDDSAITIQKPVLITLDEDSLGDDVEEAEAVVMSISPAPICLGTNLSEQE